MFRFTAHLSRHQATIRSFSLTARSALPNWTINLPAGWTSGGIVQSGNEVLLSDLQPVPEPSTTALLAAGIVGVIFRAWSKAQRKRNRSEKSRDLYQASSDR